MENKVRIGFLDMVRTVAICLVVLNHCVETVYHLDYNALIRFASKTRIFVLSSFTLGRLGVPLFLFLTGYLVLSKNFDSGDKIRRFYRHNYIPLLVTCEIWIILYNMFNAIIDKKNLAVDLLWRNMFFLEHISMMNAWYIPMILGVYLFIPYVARILKLLPAKGLLFLGLLLFSYYFVVPSCNLILAVWRWPRLYRQIDLNYSRGTYGFYLLLGYWYHRYEERINCFLQKPLYKNGIVISNLVVFTCTVVLQNWRYVHHAAYNVWYDFMFLPLIGFSGFILLCCSKTNNRLFYHMSLYSFAVYLIHVPIIRTLVKFGLYMPNRRTGIFVLWGGTMALSLLSIYLLTRVPLIKKRVFMLKE